MKDCIKRVSIPTCGVMLGVAALGNLLQSYSEGVRTVCGIIAALLLVLVLLKLILFPKMVKEDMQNPIMASVAATFPMALMLLSVYGKPLIGQAAFVIWLIAIALHLALIVYFTGKFLLKPQLPKVFASYFIVYVGIAVTAITAPAYNMLPIGTAAFWFGLVCFVGLMALITMRYVKLPDVPNPAKPLICIFAAPLSLCIAGYVQSVTPKSRVFLLAMAGSTAGGIKVSRIVIAMKGVYINTRKLISPRYVPKAKFEGKALDQRTINDVFAFITLYFFIFLAALFLLSFDPVNGKIVNIVSDAGPYSVKHGFLSNFSAVLTCISNVGPAYEAVGPYSSFAGYNGLSKIILTCTMMLGRLEILPVLILFNRRTWNKV